MKKIKLFLLYLVLVHPLSSTATGLIKESPKGQIGLTYSGFGQNAIINSQNLVGGPGFYGDSYNTFGLCYLYPINRSLGLEMGIDYSEHKITIEPNLPLIYGGTSSSAKLSIINLPVAIQLKFLKYFYINGGLFLGMDISNSSPVDRQSGLGGHFGLGFRYSLNSGFSVFVNPYSKIHSLLTLSHTANHQHILESGFRFGFMFKLK